MSEYTLEELYNKVEKLLEHCHMLQADNNALRTREQQLLQERSQLIEKNDQARTRVEAMIGHLKNLQQGVS